jgi:DNA-binding CsgD family transcriptional regulator
MHHDDQQRNPQTEHVSWVGRADARVVARTASRRAQSATAGDGADDVLNVLGACGMDLTVNLLWSVDALAGRNVARDVTALERRGLVSVSPSHVVGLTAPGRRQAALLDHVDRARLRSSVGQAGAVTGSVPPKLVAGLLIDGLVVEPDGDVLPRLVDDAERHVREGRHEDARDVLREVVAAIEFGHPVSDQTRQRAYVRLSLVLRWAGDVEEAEVLACRVLDVARLSARPIDLAIASLVWRPNVQTEGTSSVAALIDEALCAVAHDDHQLRAVLLASRATEAMATDPRAARVAAAEALELARHIDDPDTFIRAAGAYLTAHQHPGRHAETLELACEMVAVAPGAIEGREHGAIARLHAFFELGDFAHFDSELNALWRRIGRRSRPYDLVCAHLMSAARAQTRGDWATARTHGVTARVLATQCGYSTERELLIGQQMIGAWQRGQDPAAFAPQSFDPSTFDSSVGADATLDDARRALRLGWQSRDMPVGEIVGALDRLLADGMASTEDLKAFGPIAASLSIAAVGAKSMRHARILFDGIAPFSGQWASSDGALAYGPYDYHLGTLAALLRRRTEAVEFLQRALTSCVDNGCAAWETRVRLAMAELADTDDARRDQATAALALAERLAMRTVAHDARMLLASIENPAGLTDREIEVLMLLIGGGTNRHIADDLHLSVKTVERHLLNAYRKVGATNRAEASAFAARNLMHRA